MEGGGVPERVMQKRASGRHPSGSRPGSWPRTAAARVKAELVDQLARALADRKKLEDELDKLRCEHNMLLQFCRVHNLPH